MLKKFGFTFTLILICCALNACEDDKGSGRVNNDASADGNSIDAGGKDGGKTDPLAESGSYKRLCASGGFSSNGDYQLTSCIGPVDLSGPQLKNSNYTLESGAFRP